MYKPSTKELSVMFVIGLGSFLAFAAFVFTDPIAAVIAISLVVAEYQRFARKSARRSTGPTS